MSPAITPAAATAVVDGYEVWARFARTEADAVSRPRLLRGLLRTARHVAEVPCGVGHFLADYAATGVKTTLRRARRDRRADLHPYRLRPHRLRPPRPRATRLRLRTPPDLGIPALRHPYEFRPYTVYQGLRPVRECLHAIASRQKEFAPIVAPADGVLRIRPAAPNAA